jgi:hypothetical protein
MQIVKRKNLNLGLVSLLFVLAITKDENFVRAVEDASLDLETEEGAASGSDNLDMPFLRGGHADLIRNSGVNIVGRDSITGRPGPFASLQNQEDTAGGAVVNANTTCSTVCE